MYQVYGWDGEKWERVDAFSCQRDAELSAKELIRGESRFTTSFVNYRGQDIKVYHKEERQ